MILSRQVEDPDSPDVSGRIGMVIETLDPVGGVALKLNVIRIKWTHY